MQLPRWQVNHPLEQQAVAGDIEARSFHLENPELVPVALHVVIAFGRLVEQCGFSGGTVLCGLLTNDINGGLEAVSAERGAEVDGLGLWSPG
jgi:hypothetical protein